MVIFLSGHRLRNNREVTGSVVLNTGNCLFTSVSQAWVENVWFLFFIRKNEENLK